jgi:pyridoxine 4-dehydrogenase
MKGSGMSTLSTSLPGGAWTLGDLTVTRFGYGAMQLAGPGVMGPPADHDGALAVLREAVDLGITHIDTSDAYGPRVTNQLIREALHPYPESLHVVTKVGAIRDQQGGWPPAREPEDLRRSVHENLETLGLEVLDLVNLRLGNAAGPQAGSLAEPFETLVELQQQGLIRHLGVSNATAQQVAEAQAIAPIVCVQNMYNLAYRQDDELIDMLAEQGIAYVPFFPLGGFSPLQFSALSRVAVRLHATPMSVALAWLLQRSPNILLIPGTSSVAHLRENAAGAGLSLSDEDLAELDKISRSVRAAFWRGFMRLAVGFHELRARRASRTHPVTPR